MDGGEINDVEAQLRDLGQARLAIFEASMSPRNRGRGAREEFIPGAEARLFPIHLDGEDFIVGAGRGFVRKGAHELCEPWVKGLEDLVFVGFRGALQGLREGQQGLGDGGGRPPRGLLDPLGADRIIDVLGEPRPELFLQVHFPGGEGVDPGLQGVFIKTQRFEREFTEPAIVP